MTRLIERAASAKKQNTGTDVNETKLPSFLIDYGIAIARNVAVEVRSIHVRFEDKLHGTPGVDETGYTAGLTVSSLTMLPACEDGLVDSWRKRMQLKQLTIYCHEDVMYEATGRDQQLFLFRRQITHSRYLELVISGAAGLPSQAGPFGSKPDVYCTVVQRGVVIGRTGVVKDSTSPTWDGTSGHFILEVPEGSNLEFSVQVWHKATVARDTLLGSANFVEGAPHAVVGDDVREWMLHPGSADLSAYEASEDEEIEWHEYKDETSGERYWFNHITGESRRVRRRFAAAQRPGT